MRTRLLLFLLILCGTGTAEEMQTWIFPIAPDSVAPLAEDLVKDDWIMTPTRTALTALKVSFPEGSYVQELRGRKEIIIRNTLANLQKINGLFENFGLYHSQVEIRMLIMEVPLELAARWGLGNGVAQDPAATPLGKTIPPVLLPTDTAAVINGLRQQKGVTVAGSASIITISGNVAVVKAVDERFMPAGWLYNSKKNRVPPPQFGGATEVGLILTVSPVVSANGHHIDLALTPEIITCPMVEEPHPGIKLPIVRKRSCDTKITIANGSTLVLCSAKPGDSTSAAKTEGELSTDVTLIFVTGTVIGTGQNCISLEQE